MRQQIDLCCPADGAWVADGNWNDNRESLRDVLSNRAEVKRFLAAA